MKLTTTIDDIKWAAGLCIKCGGCTYGTWPENPRLCPLYDRDPCFTNSGGGFMRIVHSLGNERLGFDQALTDFVFTCTGCLACDSRCGIIRSHKPNVEPSDMIRLIRREVIKRGFFPNNLAKQIYEEVMAKGDVGVKRCLELPEELISDQADTVIFAECSHTNAEKSISAAVASLLGKIGNPVTIFAEQGCCGSILYDYGFWDQLLPLMEVTWEKMKSIKDKQFVFFNPHCQEFIVKRYPENLSDVSNLKNQHISQLIVEAFKNGKLKSNKTEKVKVSFHDPCYLGRGLGIYEPPREVLTSLKGVELTEMTRNRVNSYCCGAKAMGHYYDEMSKVTARERVEEFKATGAELLITACPYCKENFQKVMSGSEKDRVMDLVEFVNERVE